MQGSELLILAVAALGCGSRGDPGPVDAAPEPIKALDAGAADAPAGDGMTQMQNTSARLFPEGSPWYRDVSAVPADIESPAMIGALTAAGGFGSGELLVDFTFELNTADLTTPLVPLTPGPLFSQPDCDVMPVPLPAGGAVRDEAGYECTKNGECHLLVVQPATRRLFELWKASAANGVLTAGCLAVWDSSRIYGPSGRGTDCASADSSGMPIAALLFSADEVKAGDIPHALRLSLPADRIPARRVSVARHPRHPHHHRGAERAAAGGSPAPARRLPAGGSLAGREGGGEGAAALRDAAGRGRPKALTARSDRSTSARWAGQLGERDLAAVKPADFVVVDSGRASPTAATASATPDEARAASRETGTAPPAPERRTVARRGRWPAPPWR